MKKTMVAGSMLFGMALYGCAGSPEPTTPPVRATTPATRPTTPPPIQPTEELETEEVSEPEGDPTEQVEEPDPEPEVAAFRNCAEAREAGADPVHRGDPGYSLHIDRDEDGVACE